MEEELHEETHEPTKKEGDDDTTATSFEVESSGVPPTPAPTPVAAAPVLPGMETPAVPVSANAFASGANINGAQVMTGRPTSRVRHPGGSGGPDSGWTLG